MKQCKPHNRTQHLIGCGRLILAIHTISLTRGGAKLNESTNERTMLIVIHTVKRDSLMSAILLLLVLHSNFAYILSRNKPKEVIFVCVVSVHLVDFYKSYI